MAAYGTPLRCWKTASGALLVIVYKNLTNSSPSSDSGRGLSLLIDAWHASPSGWGEPWADLPPSVCLSMPGSASSCQEAFRCFVSCLFPLYFSSFTSFGLSQTCAFIQRGFLTFGRESGWKRGVWGLPAHVGGGRWHLCSIPAEKLKASGFTSLTPDSSSL